MSLDYPFTIHASTLDEMIAELRTEMRERTVESIDPWYPYGGEFAVHFDGLTFTPSGDELDAIKSALAGEARTDITTVVFDSNVVTLSVERPASLSKLR